VILETYLAKTKQKIRALASRKAHFKKNLMPQPEDAIKSLKNNKNIRISKADKGRKTVILNRGDYIDMGNQILNDVNAYEVISGKKEDIITGIYNSYEEVIKEQLDLGNITIEDWNYLHQEDMDGIQLATVYVLPKLHKQVEDKVIPKGRPIVSTTDAPHRKIDNFVASFMSPFINRERIPNFIQNTPDLLRQVKKVNTEYENNLPPSALLQTQDVQAMYLSIYVDECVEIWLQIWSEEGTHIPLRLRLLFSNMF
jgi:hypothetical protein